MNGSSKDSCKSTTTTTSTTTSIPCLDAGKCVGNCAGYGRVCPLSARNAGRAACRAVQKLCRDSTVFDPEPRTVLNGVLQWQLSDVTIGEKLGAGGFSEVHKVHYNPQPGPPEQEPSKKVYAIKYLKREVMVHPKALELGAADLAVEAYFLAALHHPNIVQLHAVTHGNLEENWRCGSERCFFLIIDYLDTTLERQIEAWRQVQYGDPKRRTPLLLPASAETKAKRHRALLERIKVARQVCTAMEYLHEKNIVYRDLKPDNVGMKDGVIKLFDFGLAKELRESLKTDAGTYKLTGKTGSRRYMAPEVANELPYDQSVDVYSFGILLWEMCAMEKPFLGYSSGKHQKQVVLGDERPKVEHHNATTCWPVELQWLLKRCWNKQPVQRPTFVEVGKCLDDIVADKRTLPAKPDRLRVTSNEPAPNLPNFGTVKRAPKPQGQRARTWGFPTRKQVSKNEP